MAGLSSTEMARCCLLLLSLMLVPTSAHGEDFTRTAVISNINKRIKREWIWNKMHIIEEHNGTLPHHVGRITSTIRNPNAKYVLEGEGAGTLFRVEDSTGDVSANERLDREKKAEYHLKAHILDRFTNKSLEQPSVFRIIVYDINDNAPVFVQKVFNGSVLEMSPLGTSVTKVTAVDADDPTILGNTRVSYKVIQGNQYFKIDDTGTIYTAVPDLDREKTPVYTIVVEAVDGHGLHSEESGTATVRISLTDINDNFPTFRKKNFHFEVPENTRLDGEVGRLEVEDIDEPQNRNTKYSFVQGPYQDTFRIEPNPFTNEGIIRPKKPLDFEKVSSYKFDVEATDADINYAYSRTKGSKSIASVTIKVLDVDEPPVFSQPFYIFEVQEESDIKKVIGSVSAHDPDRAKRQIRYHILRSNYFKISTKGHIFALKPLDREESAWHNITVAANELEQDRIVPNLETHVPVYIKVTDINDNAPEFADVYNPRVCENAAPGKTVIMISAVDKDEMSPGVKFKFSLVSEESNFTLIDNHVIMVLIVMRKRHRKDLNILRKNVTDIHEQLVAYDEEGGGEMDTTSYDVSVLNSVRQTSMRSPRMTMENRPCVYSRVQKPPGNGISGTGEMGIMIEMKKDEADNDGDLLPYDTLHIYGYEGAESIAESLSSLGSGSSDSDIDYDFLNDWGPRFKMLAELYGLEPSEDLLY
uniref:cadherin-5 isoform X3 n=1 Tax=Podarcis muralis TaxID=64176 RepID=UPI00109F20D3|nr:cadherin-5 isoform X3 [Podarcis muralis]